MKKQVCNCGSYDFSDKDNSTFFLFPNFNNKFAPINTNPKIQTILTAKQTDNNGNSLLNTNRSGPNPDCATPYRVPYNHYRKSYTCESSCTPNEKIIKDTPNNPSLESDEACSSIACRRKNYASTRLVNKFGIRNVNSGLNYKNYLQKNAMLHDQNAAGLLPENKVDGYDNLYKVGTVNGINSTDMSMCKIGFMTAGSITEKKYQIKKIETSTKKHSNPGYRKNGGVSSRNRLQRLKYNTILAGQINNCVNGQICSMYSNNLKQNKKFIDNNVTKQCKPFKMMKMTQTCK